MDDLLTSTQKLVKLNEKYNDFYCVLPYDVKDPDNLIFICCSIYDFTDNDPTLDPIDFQASTAEEAIDKAYNALVLDSEQNYDIIHYRGGSPEEFGLKLKAAGKNNSINVPAGKSFTVENIYIFDKSGELGKHQPMFQAVQFFVGDNWFYVTSRTAPVPYDFK